MQTERNEEMLKPLVDSELRSLALRGMNLDPTTCFLKTEDDLLSWIASRTFASDLPEEDTALDTPILPFSEVVMETEYLKTTFRSDAYVYVTDVQKFLRGENDAAPTWPGESEAVKSSAKTRQAASPAGKDQKDVAVKKARGRGRPRKVSVERLEAEKAKAVAELTPPTKKTERKLKIKKVSLGSRVSEATEPSPQDPAGELPQVKEHLDTINKALANIDACSLKQMDLVINLFAEKEAEIADLKNQVSAFRTEQASMNTLVSNGLLFLLNSVVYSEGEEVSDLSQVPEPSSYLDLD